MINYKKIFSILSILLLNFVILHSQNFSIKFVKIIKKDDTGQYLKVPTFVKFNYYTNRLCVIDAPKGRVIVYNKNFFPFFSAGLGREVLKPIALAFFKKKIFVCEQKQINKYPKISIFSTSWRKLNEITIRGFEGDIDFFPKRIAASSKGNIYLVGSGIDGIVVISSKGKFLKIISIKDSISEEEKPVLVNFSDIFIGNNDQIYAVSEGMGKVYVFSKFGRLLFKASQKGGTKGKLSRPRGISVDEKNKLIFVVDYMRQIVQLMDIKGKFLTEFGGYGNFPGYFNYPTSITVDNDGYIYVADMFNSRVQVFKIIKNQ